MKNTLKTGELSDSETILCQSYREGATTVIRRITDKKELYKLIAYLTMGDGGVYIVKGMSKGYFVLVQKEDHLDFIHYAQAIIDNVTSTSIKFIDRSNDNDANRANQWRLWSKSHPIFTQMRESIYVDRYKSVSNHYLKAMDWESLSILYMSDGCCSLSHGKPNVTLNMKRLSYGDQLLLKRALESKGMGVWNVNRQNQYCYLRLRSKFIPMFMENISPYIVPSYQYKVIPDYRMSVPTNTVGGDTVCSA